MKRMMEAMALSMALTAIALAASAERMNWQVVAQIALFIGGAVLTMAASEPAYKTREDHLPQQVD